MIFIGVVTETQWRRFCEVFERPDLAGDARLGSNGERVEQREWLIPALAGYFGQFTAAELLEKSERAELAFGPVNRPDHLIDDPHLNHEGHLVEVTLPDGKVVKAPRFYVEMGERWFSARRNPPDISEHAREVLGGIGLEEGAIHDLAEKGLIVLPDGPNAAAAE